MKTHTADQTATTLAIAASLLFTALLPAAPMDSITLADFDFSTEQQTRTQTLINNGTIDLQRVLTAPSSGYRHMGWPVATRLPDGRTIVLIRNLRNHSGYESYPDNARRVIWSDTADMGAWLPADVLTAAPALGGNTGDDIVTYGNYDYSGMHAISWAIPSGASTPRLVVVTAKDDRTPGWPAEKVFRVYLSDDRGVTWREQAGALSSVPTGAVHCGPNMIRHPEFGLIVPFGQQTGSGANRQNYLASSTNAGVTWQVRTWTNSAASRSIEPALATWGPGHMVMIGRERDITYGYDSASGKYYYTQHVYRHTPGSPFSAVSFTTARTNIAGNGKTPTAKGKNAYEAHDTPEVIYNPVTGRIEMIQSSRWGNGSENPLPADPSDPDQCNNSLSIWSIDPVDLLNGSSTWRFDGNLIERQGIILGGGSGTYGAKGNKDGFHPGSSIVDEAAGKQHIFIYVGVYTAYANAYRISRPLDTYAFREACGLPALPKPAITGITNIAEDNTVTITGANYDALKEVLVGGKPATITASSSTQITITLPSGATIGDKVAVRTENGLVTSASGITTIMPIITGIAYDAIRPGNTVTINGVNLAGVTRVVFGGTAVTSFISLTDTQIVVTVPEGVTDGVISVQAPGGIAIPPGGGAYIAEVKPYNLAQPVSTQPVVAGNPMDVTASAQSPFPVSYKWQYRQNASGTWADIGTSADYQGANTNHLSVVNTTGKDGWQYRYTAMNDLGDAYSNAVTLRLLAAALPAPAGITASSGAANPDIYVIDAQAHTLQKITQSDFKTIVVAGQSDAPGSLNGAAASAQFRAPRGLAINAAGAFIIADTGNSLIRAVASSTVTTIGASAVNQPRAVAAHDTNGDTYIADTGNHVIKKLTVAGQVSIIAGSGAAGFVNGSASSAQFNAPSGIAVDIAGNLYIADTGNHVIRYISASTGSVTTIAGQPGSPGSDDGASSFAKFRSPEGVAVDANGDVFVADTGNSLIREISSGVVRTIAGQLPGIAGFKDGTGTNAWFDSPASLVIAEDASLYVADTGNAVIRRIAPGDIVTTFPVAALSGSGTSPSPTPDGGGKGGGGAPSLWLAAAMAVLLASRTCVNRRR